MIRKRGLECACGQRILARDVLSTGYELHRGGQNYVYVKFRCPHCRRIGEHLVQQSRWDWSLLHPASGEEGSLAGYRYRSRPPITVEEMVDFHYALQAPDVLKHLK